MSNDGGLDSHLSCILHICSFFLFWNLAYAKNTRVSATKKVDNSDHVTVVANQARKHHSVFSRVPNPFSSRTNFQRSVINIILADLSFPNFKQNSSWQWETTPKPWHKRARDMQQQQNTTQARVSLHYDYDYITEFKFSAQHKSTNQVHTSFKHTTIHHQQSRSLQA
jgi:hypothetical protein